MFASMTSSSNDAALLSLLWCLGDYFGVLGTTLVSWGLLWCLGDHQLGFVAHHIHLYLRARMSDEPLL